MSGPTERRPRGWGVALVVIVAGLALGCKAKPKAPTVAAAPIARAGVAAEPLSTPQTAVRLPPSQPIPPGAAPPEPEPPRPAAVPESEAPVQPAAPPSRTRPAPVAAGPRSAAPSPPQVRSSPAPQLRPLLTPEEEQDLRRRIDRSLASAEQSLARARREPVHKDRQAAAERVRAFIEQAQQARRQGDLVRARSLAERAELLASDLAQTAR